MTAAPSTLKAGGFWMASGNRLRARHESLETATLSQQLITSTAVVGAQVTILGYCDVRAFAEGVTRLMKEVGSRRSVIFAVNRTARTVRHDRKNVSSFSPAWQARWGRMHIL